MASPKVEHYSERKKGPNLLLALASTQSFNALTQLLQGLYIMATKGNLVIGQIGFFGEKFCQ
jgi:hypothetical protein